MAIDLPFDLPPAEALAFFRSLGLRVSFRWEEIFEQEQGLAFTVAKLMDLALLETIFDALDLAITEGQNVDEFRDALEPTLQQAGWWGRQEVTDPITGKTIEAELGSPSRLRLIFRNNVQQAYSAGQWSRIEEQKQSAPYLLYDSIDDDRRRPAHRRMDGTILPVDHPFWRRNMPSNGHGCRCGVTQLSRDEVERFGFRVTETPPPSGADPGFEGNPGRDRAQQLRERLAAEHARLRGR